jgi:hypothetical protein
MIGNQIRRNTQYSTRGFQFNGVAKPQADGSVTGASESRFAAPRSEA